MAVIAANCPKVGLIGVFAIEQCRDGRLPHRPE
jgi:hypothetical protein